MQTKKPNVLLILIDDMGWKDLTISGSTFYESPHIDSLMQHGVQCTNAFSSSPVCSPSRASILTGQYPATLGLTDWIDESGTLHPLKGKLIDAPYMKHIPTGETNLAMLLHANGYKTYHVGKWHLGREQYYPEHQGFDENRGGCFWGRPLHGYFSPYDIPHFENGPKGEYLCDRLTDEAIQLIHQAGDTPFYMNLWHYSVHIPCEAPEDLIAYFTKKAQRLGLQKCNPFVEGEDFATFDKVGQKVTRRIFQSDCVYAAMIANLDMNIGRVIEALQETHKLEDTLIIFTSDNGGLSSAEGSPTCNYPAAEGKGWMYDGGIRVPLSFTWKGHIEEAKTNDVPTVGADLFPTILDFLQIPNDTKRDGKSILPCLLGEEKKESFATRDLFWHYPHYGNQGGKPASAIREGDWKLIEFFEDLHVELYNTRTDISETNNLCGTYPQKTEDLKYKLHRWRKSLQAKVPQKNMDFDQMQRKYCD